MEKAYHVSAPGVAVNLPGDGRSAGTSLHIHQVPGYNGRHADLFIRLSMATGPSGVFWLSAVSTSDMIGGKRGEQMKKSLFLAVCSAACVWTLLAQDRPSMTAPVLKSEADTITFSTRFSTFSAGKSYRIGVGSTEEALENAEIELLKAGNPFSKEPENFRQEFASGYFEVEEVVAKGYVFAADELTSEDELTLRVALPRSEADRLKRIFVLVSQDFGRDRWYIMDGAELNESHW